MTFIMDTGFNKNSLITAAGLNGGTGRMGGPGQRGLNRGQLQWKIDHTANLKTKAELQFLQNNFSQIAGASGNSAILSSEDIARTAGRQGNANILSFEDLMTAQPLQAGTHRCSHSSSSGYTSSGRPVEKPLTPAARLEVERQLAQLAAILIKQPPPNPIG